MNNPPDFIHLLFCPILTNFEDGLSVCSVETANSNAYVLKNASFEKNALMLLLLLHFCVLQK